MTRSSRSEHREGRGEGVLERAGGEREGNDKGGNALEEVTRGAVGCRRDMLDERALIDPDIN